MALTDSRQTITERSYYVAGGTLRLDTPSYVVRKADSDLYDGLRSGNGHP